MTIASRVRFFRSSCVSVTFIQPEFLSTFIRADSSIEGICFKPIVAFLHQLPIEFRYDTLRAENHQNGVNKNAHSGLFIVTGTG